MFDPSEMKSKHITDGSAFEQEVHWAANRANMSRLQERFLIKWQGLSHLHVSWENELDLLQVFSLIRRKTKMYNQPDSVGSRTLERPNTQTKNWSSAFSTV
jgi:hypothetical protein